MESSILRFIWAHSRRDQLLLVLFTVAGFPFLYLSLELPKIIINEAIGGANFPVTLFGHDLGQLQYLFALSGAFLATVLFNGGFKYFVNVYRGVVGERMLRRLRFVLYRNVLRFPMPQFRKLSQGEIVSMISAETEPLGGYIGDAIALPAFQGGTLLIILIFMFVQDPLLGLAAISLYPLQTWLIPKLQRQVNLLKKERVKEVRRLSEHIGESVTGIREIHANGASRFELARFSDQVGVIFEIRYQIFRKKFFIKFL
ncbi:MAG: ABC transporter ATP-binding protein, partial [Gammaproteobacteria bacterium]|nr:ABC transporter ATP-binding protein [Gammaproteobacteria bacterium]